LLYANLVEKDDAFYKYNQNDICEQVLTFKGEEIDPLTQDDIDATFSSTSINIFNEMCNTDFELNTNKDKYLKDNKFKTASNILYLLNNKEDIDYDQKVLEIKGSLVRELFTTFDSPSCMYMY